MLKFIHKSNNGTPSEDTRQRSGLISSPTENCDGHGHPLGQVPNISLQPVNALQSNLSPMTSNTYSHHQESNGSMCTTNRVSEDNQRVLEDLSYSSPMAMETATTNTLRASLTPSNSNPTNNHPPFNHETSSTTNLEQSHHYVGYNIPGILCTPNNSASIHISCSGNHADETREHERDNLISQPHLNAITPRQTQHGNRKSMGSR